MIKLLLLSLSFAISPLAIYQNNTGVEKMQESEGFDPNYFNHLIQNNPEDFLLYWNQIVATIQKKDLSKAAQTLRWLLTMVPENEELLRFSIFYQLGRVYTEEKKQGEALGAYYQALQIYPDSKEVTVNIELLSQEGGGGSEGENEEQDKDKNEEQQEQQEEDKPNEKEEQKEDKGPKPTPKPFDSKDLSQEDVRRILDELKRQEEQIRAKVDESKPKEKDFEKDW